MPALTFHEEVMLLALRDERGTIESGAWYQMAVGGAVLAELVLAERVQIVKDGKHSLIQLLSHEPVGDALIDEWLERIAADPKTRRVAHWVQKISATKDLKGRVARDLAERGILRVDEDKILFLFTRETYPEVNPQPEQALRDRLRASVLESSGEVDPRTALLLSLAKGTGLMQLVFDKAERKAHKQRIETVVNGEACGRAVRELVEATTVAIFVACVIPVVVAS
jgi:hypothetical protein